MSSVAQIERELLELCVEKYKKDYVFGGEWDGWYWYTKTDNYRAGCYSGVRLVAELLAAYYSGKHFPYKFTKVLKALHFARESVHDAQEVVDSSYTIPPSSKEA